MLWSPFTLGTVPVLGGRVRLVRTRGWCGSPSSVQQQALLCGHTTAFPVHPFSCPLWCFHSLLVEAELLRYEHMAPGGEFVTGRATVTDYLISETTFRWK